MTRFEQEIVHADGGGSFCARRDFLRMLCVAPLALHFSWDERVRLNLGLMHDGPNGDAFLGMTLSVQESQRAAQLLGAELTARTLMLSSVMSADAVRRWSEGLDAIVVAVSTDLLENVAKALDGITVVNAANAFTGCQPNWWSVASSDRDAATWDARLERFGAAQLNDRYAAAHHKTMSPLAWQGWFAVKLLWESAARARNGLNEYLAGKHAAFDGHKGELLTFDASHVLRQPLYKWDGVKNEMVSVGGTDRDTSGECARPDAARK